MATTVCPSRLLSEDGGLARETVEWWMLETDFVPVAGLGGGTLVTGRTRWPYPGGYLRQPARLIAAVNLLRSEWSTIMRHRSESKAGEKAAK